MNTYKDSSNFEKACPPALNAWTNNLLEIVKSQQEEVSSFFPIILFHEIVIVILRELS